MTREEATAIVEGALERVVAEDALLLDLKLCERALHFRLAYYMAQSPLIRAPLTVDCEYNRHHDDEKRVHLFGSPNASKVFPDILIHQRNSDARNMVALEIKRPHQSLGRDREKLQAYARELGYRHVGHVILGHTRRGALIRQVQWLLL